MNNVDSHQVPPSDKEIPPWGKGISRNSMVGFEGQKKFPKLFWVHRPSEHTIDFLEMPTLMSESLSLG